MNARTALIGDEAGLAGLRAPWLALWRRSRAASPFASPDWLWAWWAQFGTGQPRVATLWAGDALVGVLPLYVLAEAGGAKLLPLGVGISDDLGPLIAPDAPPDAASRLLATALAGTDLPCDFPDVPPGSPLLLAAPPPGRALVWSSGEIRPALTLAATLRESIPSGIARKLRMNRHRVERIGGWAMQQATPEDWPALFDALVRLHGARWTGQGEAGVLDDPRVLACHRQALPDLIADGAMRLAVLHVQGRIAAAIQAWLSDGAIHFYLSGFDAAFAHVSPGTLLVGAMLEQAINEGRRVADFLRGGETYKYAWGAHDRRNMAARLVMW